MSQSRIAAGAALTLASLVLLGTGAAEARGHSRNVSIDDDNDATDCRQIHVRFGGRTTARAEEEMSIPDRGQLIRVRAAKNGGVRVVGWDRPDYAVKACTAAGGDDSGSADATLKQVALSVRGDEIGVTGPGDEDQDWAAYLIIQAPRKASLDLSASNGPVSLRDVGGRLTVKTVNGPVSLSGCTGDVRVDAVNGPVSISESAGDVKVTATNGPLAVSLASSRWDGAGLEARTTNGPLTLRLPDNYESGVLVEASAHSPLHCSAGPCSSARREGEWGEPRRVEMGSSSTVVHLSTTNGPVSILTGNSSGR